MHSKQRTGSRCKYFPASGTVECPASQAPLPDISWLLFDDQANLKVSNKPTITTWLKSFGEPGVYPDDPPLRVEIDYDDVDTAGTFLFLRVNDESALDALTAGGWCPLVRRLVFGGTFQLYGTLGTATDPLCTDGNKSGANSDLACVDQSAVTFIGTVLPNIITSQDAMWLEQNKPNLI